MAAKWKKDRRFYSFGRDDREREKVFKTHLKELSERELRPSGIARRARADAVKGSEPMRTGRSRTSSSL